ncbi:MAG: hypothetical protein DMG21_16910 [Acidobacteria bacterium]|nr:MAG: hypothetical protein DMG21_16910 [Acidobacteriota bacterium]
MVEVIERRNLISKEPAMARRAYPRMPYGALHSAPMSRHAGGHGPRSSAPSHDSRVRLFALTASRERTYEVDFSCPALAQIFVHADLELAQELRVLRGQVEFRRPVLVG